MKGVREFIDKLETGNGKPLYELTPEEARKVLLVAQDIDVEIPETDIETFEITLENDHRILVKIVRPKGCGERLPVVFYIHGGGWVMGDDHTHARLVAELAVKIRAAVVFPVYTPSPEAQFPATTDDLFAVLQRIVLSAADYNIDASRLAVAGDSVGGNMAIAMCLLAKDNGNNPKIACQALFYPVTDAAFETESYLKFADGPWLTPSMVNNYVKQRLVAPPVKKLYGREQVARLLVICIFKQFLSMDAIKRMFVIQNMTYPVEVAYNYVAKELNFAIEDNFMMVDGRRHVDTAHKTTRESLLVRSATEAFAAKAFLMSYLVFTGYESL